jgi:hypothetical protein
MLKVVGRMDTEKKQELSEEERIRLRRKRAVIELAITGGMLALNLVCWIVSMNPLAVNGALFGLTGTIGLYGIWCFRTHVLVEVLFADLRRLGRLEWEQKGSMNGYSQSDVIRSLALTVIGTKIAWDYFKKPELWNEWDWIFPGLFGLMFLLGALELRKELKVVPEGMRDHDS